MKLLHWILFILAFWILLAPFVADDLIMLFFGSFLTEEASLVELLRWDDLFLGLAIVVIALIVVTMEQASHKTPGLKAMHWLQVMLGAWIAAAPFALDFDYQAFTWSHVVTGGFVAVFALMQIYFEKYRS